MSGGSQGIVVVTEAVRTPALDGLRVVSADEFDRRVASAVLRSSAS